MKRYVALFIALIATLFTINVWAFTPPPAPANGGYVVDQTGKMSESQINNLNRKIERISRSTKNEFGILLLNDMDGNNIEDVANSTYKSWGVGKRGLDNGCLIVVSVKERKSRIETGKGVEGEIPDLKANDILRKNLNPHLKQGDFYGGFDSTLDALSSTMESRQGQKSDPKPSSCSVSTVGANDTNYFPLFGVLGLLFLAAAFLFYRRAKRAKEEAEARLKAERVRLEKFRLQTQQLAEEALKIRAQRENTPPPKPIPEVKETHISVVPAAKAPSRPRIPRPSPRKTVKPTATSVAVAAAAHNLAQQNKEAEERARKVREAKAAEDRRRSEDEARRRRERDEEDRRRRQRDEESSRSSSWGSSSSSFDWGGSSGGFGGGDSGGGGSSSDW